LVVREEVLGVLNVALPASHTLTDMDLAFLQVIGQQVGMALFNAQLYQQALQTDRLRVLSEISAAAVSSLDVQAVLQRILQLVIEAVGADEGGVFLVEPDTEVLILAVTRGQQVSSLTGLRLPPGQGVAGWAAQRGTAVLVNDPARDARFHSVIDALIGENRALLCAPLQHSGTVAGVIEIIHKQAGQFAGEDLALIEAVGSIIANAIENAQLYQSLQWRVKELRVLNEMGLALSATLEPTAVSRIAVSQIVRFFNARVALLLRLDGTREHIASICGLIDRQPLKVSNTALPLEDSFVRTVDQGRKPVLIQDARSDSRWSEKGDAYIGQYLDEAARAVMVVPLTDSTGPMGMLLVADTTAGIYTYQDIGTLLAVASTLSVALQNAYLYEAESRAHEKMRGLSSRLAEVEEAERRRLAHELHDRVGQDLTALDISLDIVQRQVAATIDDPADAEAILARLEDAGELVRQTNRRIRDVMDDLRPPALEEYGLLAALRWYGTKFSHRTNVPLSITGPETVPRLAPVVETALFRVAQEALTNVARHADATQVTVRVAVDEGTLRLVVADDGVGLDLAALTQPGDRQRLGLQTMIERVEGIGGLFWIESEPHQGTQIAVEVPLEGSR
jgi:signal transduction histidine kinase/putative methionine-R-sulfoxide reductase with GAF domain